MPEPHAACIICGKPPDTTARSIIVIVAGGYRLRFCEPCIRLLYLMIDEPFLRHEA